MCLLTLIAGIGLAPATDGQAESRDGAATRTYLNAEMGVVRAEVAAVPAGDRAVEEFATRFNGECAGVLVGAPKPKVVTPRPGTLELAPRQSVEIFSETLQVVGNLLTRPVVAVELRFVRAVEHLRWSNDRLTRLVRSLLASQKALARWTLSPPDLCADMKSWAASGYKTLSPETKRFLRQTAEPQAGTDGLRLLETPEEAIARMLRPHEDHHAKATARQLSRLRLHARKVELRALFAGAARLQLETPK
jgi:hypothetical protein